jgi:hypothetical protein
MCLLPKGYEFVYIFRRNSQNLVHDITFGIAGSDGVFSSSHVHLPVSKQVNDYDDASGCTVDMRRLVIVRVNRESNTFVRLRAHAFTVDPRFTRNNPKPW